jgi:succinate dehydrogenase / fumarate reductase flavoprotein subunit
MSRKDGERVVAVRKEVGEIMMEHFGILRSRERMEEGKRRLEGVRSRLKNIYLQDRGKIFNLELIEALQLYSIMDLAEVIAAGACTREESRGAHSRTDFPDRNDQDWMKHTLAYYTDQGPRLDYADVNITRIPPTERKY